MRLLRFYDPGTDTECAGAIREPAVSRLFNRRTRSKPRQPPPPDSNRFRLHRLLRHSRRRREQAGRFNFDADNRGQGRGYTWEIQYAGAFALAIVNLQPEQQIAAEAGAMVSMSANMDLHSEMKGGIFGALKRAVGGESAFVSTFTAKGGPGEVCFAPGARAMLPGSK